MKNFKRVISVLVFTLLFCLSVFGEDSPKTFFPSKATSPIYPIDKDLGQVFSQTASEEHAFLSKILKEEYSFDWAEQYLAPESKNIITTLYSNVLSSHLPSNNFLMSRKMKNADNSVSITVKYTETSDLLTFVILDSKIINISTIKK